MSRINELTIRANKGDTSAQRNLDRTFGQPIGTYGRLVANAKRNQVAAARGSVDAMISLGYAYAAGLGIDKDVKSAEFWFRRAANRGNLQALYELGKLFFHAYGDYERALPYIAAAVNSSAENGVPIPGVSPQEVHYTYQTVAAYVNYQDANYNAAHFTLKNFDQKLNELRYYFYSLDLPSKQVFIGNLRNNPTDEIKNYPKFRKFLNECIKEYNRQVKHHNSQVRLQDLRAYFDGLSLPTKRDFIQKLQDSPPEIKNQPKYRRLANEVVADYNAKVRLRNLEFIDALLEKSRRQRRTAAKQDVKSAQTDQAPQAQAQTSVPDIDKGQEDARLDAIVAHLHYYGASCANCRFFHPSHRCNVGIVFSRWKREGYNVCEKWARR
ncbi:MAG: hypothetical protein LBE55_04480 [Clostridiales bacterium]|nr:hypothetical protein [Clostridiales bacterium]